MPSDRCRPVAEEEEEFSVVRFSKSSTSSVDSNCSVVVSNSKLRQQQQQQSEGKRRLLLLPCNLKSLDLEDLLSSQQNGDVKSEGTNRSNWTCGIKGDAFFH